MDISVVISSATRQFDNLLYPGIWSIVNNCPINFELIVVSTQDVPKQDFPNTRFIKQEVSNGCASGFNIGTKEAKGEYVALTSDDYHLQGGWWNIVQFMKDRNAPYASFMNGSMCGIQFAHIPIVHRSLLESEVMKGMFYNETLFHQYLDNDLGFRIHFLRGLGCPVMQNGNWRYDGNESDIHKWPSKMKYLALDGVIFQSIWGKKIDLTNSWLHHQSVYTNEEIAAIAEEKLANDPYKDLYDRIPSIIPTWIPTFDPVTVQGVQEEQKKAWGHLITG